MSQALGTWIDGAVGSSVPADDRGLQYGDGVFETILVRNGIARFLALHRERMQRGLTRLGIPFRPDAVLDADIAPAIAMAPPLAVLKIIITRGSAARRGYAPSDRDASARRIVTLWPTEPMAPELIEQGASLDIARLRLPESSPFAGLKHLNRLENVMAAAEGLGHGEFDALMFEMTDHLVSGTACNVFLVKGGEILTPRVDRAGVAGVMRAIVLREAPLLGIAVHEQDLAIRDVITADGIFITNARIGVVPVRRVREHAFGMTDIATRLRNHIEALDA
jgi:4-amino-4-deoxychorismate lyase